MKIYGVLYFIIIFYMYFWHMHFHFPYLDEALKALRRIVCAGVYLSMYNVLRMCVVWNAEMRTDLQLTRPVSRETCANRICRSSLYTNNSTCALVPIYKRSFHKGTTRKLSALFTHIILCACIFYSFILFISSHILH